MAFDATVWTDFWCNLNQIHKCYQNQHLHRRSEKPAKGNRLPWQAHHTVAQENVKSLSHGNRYKSAQRIATLKKRLQISNGGGKSTTVSRYFNTVSLLKSLKFFVE